MIAFDAFSALELAAALVAGVALGLFHFRTLHGVHDDYLAGRAGRAVALQLWRLAVLAAVLVGLASLGAAFLLAGALGMLVGRFIVMCRAERDP